MKMKKNNKKKKPIKIRYARQNSQKKKQNQRYRKKTEKTLMQ